jgi:MarR family transcriptional regulator, organic hydroperoxide resistance regulator
MTISPAGGLARVNLGTDREREIERELGPVVSFLRVVWALDHALTRASKRMHRTMGVTGTQRFVLRLVAQSPGLSAGEIARMLHLDPGTLTGVLARLSARGALERLPDARDGRRALFRVSEAGRALAATRRGTVEDRVRQALRRSKPDDVRAAVRVLTALVDALERGG